MAFVDQLKNLFTKKTRGAAQDSRAMAGDDASSEQIEAELKSGETQYGAPEASLPPMERTAMAEPDTGPGRADQVTLPILGKKTIGQHQRVLSVLLGLSLVLLAIVTLVGLNKSERAAQQLSATGQS